MRNTYLLDGQPVIWHRLIELACTLDEEYRAASLKSTSRAAEILRQHGHSAEEQS